MKMIMNAVLILIEKERGYIQTITICVAYFRNLIGQIKNSFHVHHFIIIGLFASFRIPTSSDTAVIVFLKF